MKGAGTYPTTLGPVSLIYGDYRYHARVENGKVVRIARRNIDRLCGIEYGTGTWAGVIVDHRPDHWPIAAINGLSGSLRNREEDLSVEVAS